MHARKKKLYNNKDTNKYNNWNIDEMISLIENTFDVEIEMKWEINE